MLKALQHVSTEPVSDFVLAAFKNWQLAAYKRRQNLTNSCKQLRKHFFTTTCVTALFTSPFCKVPYLSVRVRRALWAFSHDSYQTTKQKNAVKTKYISTQT